MNDDFKSQLTALALDELPAESRASVLAQVAGHPEAKAYLDGTSEFCELLNRSLAVPEESSLTDGQRAELARQLAEPRAEVTAIPPRRRGTWASWTIGLGAAAAAVLVANHLVRENDAADVVMAPNAPVSFGGGDGGALYGGGGLGGESREQAAPTALGGGVELRAEDARKAGDGLDRQLLAEREDTRAKMLGEVDGDWVAATPGAASKPSGPSTRPEGLAANVPGPVGPGAMLAGHAAGLELGDSKASLDDAVAPASEPAGIVADSSPASAVAASAVAMDAEAAPADKAREAQASLSLEKSQVSAEAAGARGALADGSVRLASVEEKVARPIAPAEPVTKGNLATGGLRFGDNAISNNAVDGLLAADSTTPSESKDRYFRYKEDVAEERLSQMLAELPAAPPSAEAYQEVPENPFLAVAAAPLSTFSIDVDTASYANVRRFLNQGQRPPKAAVRLEELVNYFRYDYPEPAGDAPFSVTVDMADCPWQPEHRLARIGLQGKSIAREHRPAANLVFLVDVSGSMDEPNKLPLVRQSLHLLTSQLKGSDHVGIVTYAGQSGVALPSTSLEQKESVTRAIDALSAGGSTNGASGIQLAYQQARQNFKPGGVNRVILATDGDFNVGLTSHEELERLITTEAKSGVFLSVLGYGMGNLKDATMELLADKGNGNYGYIDSLSEARKVLGDQLEGTLHTIAKDVKIQIEFNPAQVRHYRLLGYENRLLAKEAFNDDTKDAGEIGAGHTVTALYEIVPAGAPPLPASVDPLKYQPVPPAVAAAPAADLPVSRESMTVKLRYKAPQGTTSQLIEVPVVDAERKFAEAPADFKFAASVAMTGLLLKDSAHKGTANWNLVRELARTGKGPDPEGYRGEFLQLVEKAAGVAP